MKANVASIETVIDILLEKDDTYRIAAKLLNTFNEYIKNNKQQGNVQLTDKSGTVVRLFILLIAIIVFPKGDISDHDHRLFDILIKDRISRLRKLSPMYLLLEYPNAFC